MAVTDKRKKGQGLAPLVGMPDPLVCRRCGGSKWNYVTTKTHVLDTSSGAYEKGTGTGDELRCANTSCNLKANLDNNGAIRQLRVFDIVSHLI